MNHWVSKPAKYVPRFTFFDDTSIVKSLPTSLLEDTPTGLSYDGSSSFQATAFAADSLHAVGSTLTYKSPSTTVSASVSTSSSTLPFISSVNSASATNGTRRLAAATPTPTTTSFLVRQDLVALYHQAVPVIKNLLSTSTSSTSTTTTTSSPTTSPTPNTTESTSSSRWPSSLLSAPPVVSGSVAFTRSAGAHRSRSTLTLRASTADHRHTLNTELYMAPGPAGTSLGGSNEMLLHYAHLPSPSTVLGASLGITRAEGTIHTNVELQAARRIYTNPFTGQPSASLWSNNKQSNPAVTRGPSETIASLPVTPDSTPGSSIATTTSSTTSVQDVEKSWAAPAKSLSNWLTISGSLAAHGVLQAAASAQLTPSVRLSGIVDTDIHEVVMGLSGVPSLGESMDRIPFLVGWGLTYNN